MAEQKATNVTAHTHLATRADREKALGQKGATLWFTGLSACGKSTIAVALEKALLDEGKAAYVLDGDNIRMGLNKNLGFSAEDRAENIRRIGEVCKLFADAGFVVIASFISPYKADRDNVRNVHEAAKLPFVECFVDTPLEICEQRDPKGLYKKARAGEVKNFTGISDPYEAPAHPELVLKAGEKSLAECVAEARAALKKIGA